MSGGEMKAKHWKHWLLIAVLVIFVCLLVSIGLPAWFYVPPPASP